MKTETKSKVVLLPCVSYEEEKIKEQLKMGIQLLGGLSSIVKPEEKILLKPNLLKKSETEKAVITHPAVMGAFALLLQEAGCKYVKAGDSCGTGTTKKIMRASGMDQVLERHQVSIVDFDKGIRREYPQGKQAQEFMMAAQVEEADALINLCKMKTHQLERITGAVKNMYGCIYGFYKAKGHTQYPDAHSFARMLVDLNTYVKPRLHIMDGIVAMEGNGPGSGEPVPMNVILMSKDPVALDSVFCHLIHLDPRLVPTNDQGEKMGLGVWQPEKITLLLPEGEISMEEAVKRYGNPEFDVDRTVKKSDWWVWMAKFFHIFQKRPYIDKEKCIGCGICVDSCPVEGKALEFRGKKAPEYNYRKCIRCFCCQEMCPQKAIRVKGLRF